MSSNHNKTKTILWHCFVTSYMSSYYCVIVTSHDYVVMSSVLTSRLHKIILLFLLHYQWIWITQYDVQLKTFCDVIQPNTNCYDDSAMMSSVLTSRFHHLLHFLLCCVMSSIHNKTNPILLHCFYDVIQVSLLLCHLDFTGFCWDVTRELHCFVASYEALCLFHHRRYCDDAAFVFFKSLCHITLLWCDSLWWDCNGIALAYDVIWVFCCIHCDHDITGFFQFTMSQCHGTPWCSMNVSSQQIVCGMPFKFIRMSRITTLLQCTKL